MQRRSLPIIILGLFLTMLVGSAVRAQSRPTGRFAGPKIRRVVCENVAATIGPIDSLQQRA